MADRPSIAELRDLLDRIDRIRHEAEAIRSHADRAIRRRPFWPERRASRRLLDECSDGDAA